MKRKIAFRAWHGEVEVDGVRYPGWMEYDPDWQNVSAVRIEHKEAIEALATDHLKSERARLNKIFSETTIPLMQFTGSLDRHGKEIYEGDILSDNQSRIGSVEYFEHAFWIRLPDESVWWPNENNRRIIGNVWENPELLTKRRRTL